MCKKFNLLLLLVLVVLTLQSTALAADPNMIAIYWMDAGEGTTVWDYTGNGRNGTMNGAVSWPGAGMIGGCLEFSGGTVDITNNVDNLSFGDVDLSVTAWIKTTAVNTAFFSKDTADGEGNNFAFGVGQNGEDALAVVTNRNRANIKSTTDVNDNEWHHLAFVQDYDEAGGGELWSMYVDGVLETRQLTDILRDNGRDGMYIGRGEQYNDQNFTGLLDELYVYGSVLDDADIPFVMEGATWKPRARDLQPVDGTVLSGTSVDLSWSAGWADTALGEHLAPDAHHVYLSTDVNAVSEGREEALVDTITGTTYSVADLAANTTYYWRIDEVNDNDATSPWTGEVLSFDVPDLAANNPVPANGTKFQSLTLDLSWTPGLGSTSHVVYIGNTNDEVENATSGGVTVTDPNYAPPGLQADKVYFWRVDEVNGGTIKGPVWTFSTVPVADGDFIDPNLIAWWKMNEGEGSTVVDYSGYGNHASFVGAGANRQPQWDEGIFGGGVRVWDGDGLGYIDVPGIADFDSPEITICGWIYLEEDLPASGWGYPFWTVPTLGSDQASIFFVNGNMRLSWPTGNYIWVHGWDIDSGLAFPGGEWFFVAASVKPDGADYYVNSATFHRAASFVPLTTIDQGANLGRAKAKQTGQTVHGLVDDWRIYNKALTAAELTEVMRGEPWLAWDPQPGNGVETDVLRVSPLSWQAGDGATAHDVYLATDPNALQNADTTDTTGVYLGRNDLADTTFAITDVNILTTYYWRVDEVQADGSIRKGNAWKFTTVDYIIIEDFEDYDANENQIWFAWHDGLGYGEAGTDFYLAGNGTGSSVGDENTASYTEETIVNSGSQSMPITYNNNQQGSAYYSEVEHMLTDIRDWTTEGVANLSLWFRGNPASVGSFTEAPAGTYTMTASGADIWGNADEFHFAYKMLTGTGSIVAKVESVDNTNVWAKAGVMIREILEPGSVHATMVVTPANGVAFQNRTVTDDTSSSTDLAGIVAPYWVKIERDITGSFTAYSSTNGSTWDLLSTVNIQMSSDVYIGLAVTSHDTALTCEAVFSNVTTTGNVNGQWANQDIGIASNDAEPLYVAVSNSAGAPAIVVHDDPAAAQIVTWTEWIIPLSAFTEKGIVLTDVDRIAIGLGTEGNTTIPGGLGKMYIDDISLKPAPVIEPNEPGEPDEPNNVVPEGDEYLIADFDTDGTGDDWLNNFGSGGRFTGRSLSDDTPDGSAASMQIDIDYSAGGWGSAWGSFSATGLGPEGTSSIDASGYTTFGCYMKSSIDGAQLNFWFEHFPGPTQGYVNEVTITGITTEWAYYEVDLSTAVPVRDGLHDMTAVNRMSFGGPADLGAPYTILLDQLRLVYKPGDAEPEGGNLLSNPGFETGTLDDSWNDGWGNRDVNSTEQRSGSYCGHFSGGAVTQKNSLQLEPNTTYTYSGYVKSSGGNVSLGVKNHGADEVAVSTTSDTYELLSVTFATGDDPSAAQVYVWCGGDTDGYADDLTLYGP